MVERLNAQQTRQLVLDLIARDVLPEYRVPDPILWPAVADSCWAMAGLPNGLSYGLFDEDRTPQGFLVGVVFDDLKTGIKSGHEHAWWVNPSRRGAGSLALLEAFEAGCKKLGCERVLLGISGFVNRKSMTRFYRRRGYQEHSAVMSKRI